MNKRVAEATALGRAGVPGDIGPMIASLLSEDNRWINAERIEVTGAEMPDWWAACHEGRSATGHFLQLFWQPSPQHRDL